MSDEQEKRLMLISELDILSNWDETVTSQDSNELCVRSSVLMTAAEKSEDQTFLIKSWACWSFRNTVIPGTGGKKKWQLSRIADPKTGEMPPYAESWKEFSERHLRMAQSTSSGYKAIWDTYVIKLGIDTARLSIAGKSKLLVAQKLIKDIYPGINKELMDALLDPTVTLAELSDLVNKLRALMGDDPEEDDPEEPKGTFEGALRYDQLTQRIHWAGFFVYKEDRYPLNELVFDILGPNVIGEGVPEELAVPLMRSIQEALG